MIPQHLIRRKRDGEELTGDELAEFLRAYAAGHIAE